MPRNSNPVPDLSGPRRVAAACTLALLLCMPFAASESRIRAQEETAGDTATTEDAAATPAVDAEDGQKGAGSASEDKTSTTLPPVELPPELQPYKVLLSVSFQGDASIDGAFRNHLVASAPTLLKSRLGQMWTLTVRDSRLLSPATRDVLDRMTVDVLNARFLPEEFDKVILCSVGRRGSAWEVAAREWDRNSRTAGPTASRETYDRRLVDNLVASTAVEVFRPLAMIREVGADVVELGIRAGEFLAADDDAAQFQPGDYLVTYSRYLDRQRKVGQIQFVPWTFLQVDSVERARMLCHVISTFRRSPYPGSRRRVELMGIAAHPLIEKTRLILVPRVDPLNPLEGLRVDVMDRMPTEDDAVEDRVTLLTDRHGAIVVSTDRDVPLYHLLVHSGGAVLASVPFIPGLEREVTLELPDDTPRLNVEGELQIMEDDLIDVVASRAVMMARARRAARSGKWDDVDRFLDDLRNLPDLQEFDQRLGAIETPAKETAKKLGDRVAQSRITRLCREFREIAQARLSPDIIRDFQTDMNQLRSTGR